MVWTDWFFFALFALFRFSISIGLLERPLCIGLIWALVTGDYSTSLKIAIFFELAWLDMIPAGTYIPPHLVGAVFTALALTAQFGFENPTLVALAMAAGVPMAWFGTRLEALLRTRQNASLTKSLLWAEGPAQTPFPTKLIHRSLLISFGISWSAFVVSCLVLHFLLGAIVSSMASSLDSITVTWPQLWIAASFGGLLSLRVRQAYAVFFSGAALVAVLLLCSLF